MYKKGYIRISPQAFCNEITILQGPGPYFQECKVEREFAQD